ncbi:MAG: hypothetical protein KUG78_03140 [Kangiellaceae bacterium]|nr:hypothetical protein [Kangiellaceae bacterium]
MYYKLIKNIRTIIKAIKVKKYAPIMIFLLLPLSTNAIDIDVTVSNSSAAPGESIYHRVIISNTDDQTRNNVEVSVISPVSTSFIDPLPIESSGCVNSCDAAETAVWSLGSMQAGETKVIIIPVIIDSLAADGTSLVFTPSVTYTGLANPETDSVSSSVSVAKPAVVHIAAKSQLVAPGEQIYYEISYGNIGNSAISSTELRVSIPAGTTFISATDNGTVQGTEVVWDFASAFNVNDTGKVFFSVQTNSSDADGEIYSNQVELIASNTTLQFSQESVVIRDNVNLTLTSTVMGDVSQPSKGSYYRYVIANHGANDIAGVTLYNLTAERTLHIDALPLESSGCVNSCDSAEWAQWDLDTIKAGESKVIVVPLLRASPLDGEALESHIIVTDATGAYTLGQRPTLLAEDETSWELIISPDRQVIGSSEVNKVQLTYSNIDNTAATNMNLDFIVPVGMTFISASDGGTLNEGVVSWDLATINPATGGFRLVTLESSASVQDGEVVELNAELSNESVTLHRSSDSLVVKNNLTLTLTSAVMGDVSQPDKNSYYRYVIANHGSNDIAGVTLYNLTAERTLHIDALPLESSGCVNSCDSAEWAQWDLNTIRAGESKVIVVPLQRASPLDGEALENHILVTDATGAYTLGQRPTLLAENETSWELIISPDKQVIGNSETNKVQLTYSNLSNVAATNMNLDFVIPVEMTFVSASDGGMLNGGIVSWDLSTVNAASGGFRLVTLASSASVQDGEVVELKANIFNDTETLHRSSDSLVVRKDIELTLNSTVMGDVSQPNKDSYYRYVIANHGSNDIAGVTFYNLAAERTGHIDALPLESSGCVNSCDSAEWAQWDLNTIKAGESRVIVVPVFRSSPLDGEALESHVIVTEATGAYTLGQRPTLLAEDETSWELIISPDKQVIESNEIIRIQLTYANIGSSTANNINMNFTLPNNMTFVSASDEGILTNGVVNWNLETVNASNSGTRFVTLQSNSNQNNGMTIILEASLSNSTTDVFRSNDSLVIKEGIPLTLNIATSGFDSTASQDSYYRFVVANNGANDVTDVSLYNLTAERTTHIDSLPLETSGCVNSCDSAEWAYWDLGTIEAGESKIIVVPIVQGTTLSGEALESHVIVTEASEAYTLGMRPTLTVNDAIVPQLVVASEESLVSPSELQHFTISVGNPTGTTFTNGMITVEIPTSYTFDSATGVNEVKDGKIYWPIGNVNPNQWLTESLVLQVDNGVVDGSALKLEARIDSGGSEGLMGFSSVVSTVSSQASMKLSASSSFTSPLTQGDTIDLTMIADNESNVQVGSVSLYSMTSLFTTASNLEVTSGCVNSCDSAEWAYWDLASIDSLNDDSRIFEQTLTSGISGAFEGQILISNIYLSNTAEPTIDQSLLSVNALGQQFIIDPNHDSDADGIPDWWEIRWGYNRMDNTDAATDDDFDGSTNLEEYTESTDPTDSDSDDDGILDGPDTDPLVDNPPTSDAGDDFNVRENNITQLNGTNSIDGDDPDNTTALVYTWSQLAGTNVILDNTSSDTPSFTAPTTAPEDLVFQLEVEDSTGNTAIDSVTVSITVDSPPQADAGPDQIVGSGVLVTLSGDNSSDDFDAVGNLSFQWTEITTSGIVLSDSTVSNPTFTTPDLVLTGGTIRFSLVVTDTSSQTSDADEVIINVSVGVAPTADAGPDQNIVVEQSVQLTASNSSDTDGSIETYLWSQTDGETVSLSDTSIETPTFTAPINEGTLTFMLTVTDNDGLSDDDEVMINVGTLPTAICEAGPSQDVNEFDASGVLSIISLDASNSSIASGTIESYLWRQVLGDNVTLTTPNQVSTAFTTDEVDSNGSSYTFEVTCTSNLGALSTDEVIINIIDLNRAPTSNAGIAQQVDEGNTVTLDGSLSEDIDGDSITYLWSLKSSSNGSGITLDSTTVESPQFTAPDVNDATGESFVFELIVDDGTLSDMSEVLIQVMGTDTPPTADAGSDITTSENRVVNLDGGNSSDMQGDVSYQWSQVSGVQVTLTNPTQAITSFTSPPVSSGSIQLEFELTVTDSASNIHADQVRVTVNDVVEESDSGGGGSIYYLLIMLLAIRAKRGKIKVRF